VLRPTARLVVRSWTDADLEPFAALNADPAVMEHFPSLLSRADSDALARRIDAFLADNGWGLWAVEVRDSGRFVGFTGLSPVGFTAHFTPAVEVGWRLAGWAWGHGYATEAAREALRIGFDEVGLNEIVSFTSVTNVRSQAVMQRLGMTHNPVDDFNHPALPDDSPLRRHVLYRIARADL
jgi:RimJ/RimL family protein N-acetyltransferase